MGNYVIFTDSACDISQETLKEWNVKSCSLSFRFDQTGEEYDNYSLSAKDFYERMRAGQTAKTSAANTEMFRTAFEEELKAGNDILYLGFSSGLSTTYNSGRLAAEELKEEYPDRNIIAIDTLAASAGFGLLLYLTVKKKEEGASIEDAAQYASDLVMKLCHWFTVDDLVYLKRGGRVSAAAALVGGLLGIKPVLHVDNEGHLINMSKVRGRKAALQALADQYGKLAIDKKDGTVFISHGDCIDDAKLLAQMLSEQFGATVQLITDVGPVIGAHSGPGTLALFFVGTER